VTRRGRERRRGSAAAAACGLIAVVLTGCSAGTPPAARADSHVPTFTIDMNDQLRFKPDTIVIPKGTDALKLVNVGSVPHNLHIPALKVLSPTIDGGQTVTITIHATTAGTYAFDCDFHVMDGMVGTLIVR
jgi:plastocyanin